MRLISFLLIISVSLSSFQNPSFITAKTFTQEEIVGIIEASSSQKKIANSVSHFIINDEFGDQELFWIEDAEIGEYLQVRATLLSVGDHCYIYMDNQTVSEIGESAAITKCERLKEEFDSVIYPAGTQIAGNPDGLLFWVLY